MRATVHRLSMSHPGDVSALADLIERGVVRPAEIVAVLGKTEGNGGVNDFTRGFLAQSLALLLAPHFGGREAVARRIPFVFSGGTEGVLSPHYVVFCRAPAGTASSAPDRRGALAIGTAFSAPLPPEEVGRLEQVRSVADTVRRAMADAGIEDPADVRLVQVKCPCVTASRARQAAERGAVVRVANAGRSMAYARAAGALGVALALGEIAADAVHDDALLSDFGLFSSRASVSSGVEVDCNEVILLGNAPGWSGPLRIAHRPMRDALDIAAVHGALDEVGIAAAPQVSPADGERLACVLVKCEPDRRGLVRQHRHTMLDDTDIDAQRHIRGAVGGLVAGVLGDGRVFVSGGAEHQGPDGGGLVAVIAAA